MSARSRSFASLVRVECLSIVRDRRAMFAAFVLPLVLFPLLFWISGFLERSGKERMESMVIRYALDVRALDEVSRTELLTALREEGPIDERMVDAALLCGFDPDSAATPSEHEQATALLGEAELLVSVCTDPSQASASETAPRVRRWLRSTDEASLEADRRFTQALDKVRISARTRRLTELFGTDPGAVVLAKAADQADPTTARGRKFGLWAPLILIFTLVGSASWVALAAFAGEREQGTLETLLVQPIDGRLIAQAKYVVVVVVTLASLSVNALGFLATAGLGLISGMDSAGSSALAAGRVFAAIGVYVPCVLLVCAVLCLITARAKTFREGQNLLLPIMLVLLLPMVPLPGRDPLLLWSAACTPLAGSALAVRETLAGSGLSWLVATACAAQLAWAWLFVRRVGRLLDGERALAAGDEEREAAARAVQSRRALRWTMGAIFALYVVGGALQAWNLVLGLALTLWGIALPLALLSARGTARRARESLGQTLGLTRVAPLALLGALLLAPALALGAGELFALQQRILPLPDGYNAESMLGALLTLPLWAKLFLIAITPAICEELLFRGALLSGLRRDHGWWRTTLIVAVLFGLVHASIYRFLPTGLLGAILAMTTLSSRSLWPAIALHAAYNGLLVMQGEGWTVPAASAWLALPGLALLVLQLRLVQTQDQEHHANEAQQRA